MTESQEFQAFQVTESVETFDSIEMIRDTLKADKVFRALNSKQLMYCMVNDNEKQLKRLLQYHHSDDINFYFDTLKYGGPKYAFYRPHISTINNSLILENSYISRFSTVKHTFYPFSLIDYNETFNNCLMCENCDILITSCVCNNNYIKNQSNPLFLRDFKERTDIIQQKKCLSMFDIYEIKKMLKGLLNHDFMYNQNSIIKVTTIRQCEDVHILKTTYKLIERPTFINSVSNDKSTTEMIYIVTTLFKSVKSKLQVKDIIRILRAIKDDLEAKENSNNIYYYFINTFYHDLYSDLTDDEKRTVQGDDDEFNEYIEHINQLELQEDEESDSEDEYVPIDKPLTEGQIRIRNDLNLFRHIRGLKQYNARFLYRGVLLMENTGPYYRIIYKSSRRVPDNERFNIINQIIEILRENNLNMYFDRK
jgi:hypothetical protein